MTNSPMRRRVAGVMRAAGIEPEPWQVESLAASLVANGEQVTDEDLTRALMRAPWFPKPSRRHWRVGEGGGLAVRSDG